MLTKQNMVPCSERAFQCTCSAVILQAQKKSQLSQFLIPYDFKTTFQYASLQMNALTFKELLVQIVLDGLESCFSVKLCKTASISLVFL